MYPDKHQRWVDHTNTIEEVTGEGTSRRILAYTDGLMTVENHFKKGGIGAMHSHPHTQITYVVSGKFQFTIGDETRIVKTGDTLLKEDGIVHGCECLEDGILLDIFTPMRQDFINEP